MQSHQFHNLHGNREATESCKAWVLYTEGRRVEQETKQHVNKGIYSMDMQTPPRPWQRGQQEVGPAVLRG